MRVRIDAELCTACGLCADEVPEVFRNGDDGIAQVINPDVPANLEARVKAQADDCPGSAIIVEN